MWPVGDDEAEQQTGVLSDEVVADLAHQKQGYDAKALIDAALAIWWVRPGQRHVLV